MKAVYFLFICLIYSLTISSCSRESSGSKYSECDRSLYNVCTGKDDAPFCTFGFKWGSGNPFSKPGANKPGPGLGGITLKYMFIDAGYTFNTHRQENIQSTPFDESTNGCGKEKFRKAFAEWASVANINFIETTTLAEADLKILSGNIEQSSVGYGNYVSSTCKVIKGQIIFQRGGYSCTNIYGAVLHEIGHALGLGHVNSKNVMHPSESTTYTALQTGDILGVQSIYGMK